MIGNNRFFSNGNNGSFLRLLSFGESKNKLNIAQIIKAVTNLSKTKTGALIVLDLNSELKFYTASGEKLSSPISSALLESIFFKNSPLHDGGVIIENNKITAARCILPVSDNQEFPDHFGLRHRAAAGITENSQSFSIIISEETGKISTAKAGKINYNLSIEELNEKLKAEG